MQQVYVVQIVDLKAVSTDGAHPDRIACSWELRLNYKSSTLRSPEADNFKSAQKLRNIYIRARNLYYIAWDRRYELACVQTPNNYCTWAWRLVFKFCISFYSNRLWLSYLLHAWNHPSCSELANSKSHFLSFKVNCALLTMIYLLMYTWTQTYTASELVTIRRSCRTREVGYLYWELTQFCDGQFLVTSIYLG